MANNTANAVDLTQQKRREEEVKKELAKVTFYFEYLKENNLEKGKVMEVPSSKQISAKDSLTQAIPMEISVGTYEITKDGKRIDKETKKALKPINTTKEQDER